MIELTVLNFLKSKLSVPVTMEVIDEPEYVLLEKTGSSNDNHIYNATFAIQSYSDSLYDAALLNEAVKIAMLGDGMVSGGLIDEDIVCSCDLNSDYNYTDTSTKKYRYQAIFSVIHYEKGI